MSDIMVGSHRVDAYTDAQAVAMVKQVRDWQFERNLNDREMAAALGVSRVHWCQVCNGRSVVGNKLLAAIDALQDRGGLSDLPMTGRLVLLTGKSWKRRRPTPGDDPLVAWSLAWQKRQRLTNDAMARMLGISTGYWSNVRIWRRPAGPLVWRGIRRLQEQQTAQGEAAA